MRFGMMKKKQFCNVAWQMYVDAAKAAGDGFITTAGSSSTTRSTAASAAAHDHGLRTAILVANPSFTAVELAAEEFVEAVVRDKVQSGDLPVEVACPIQNNAWDTHADEAGQSSSTCYLSNHRDCGGNIYVGVFVIYVAVNRHARVQVSCVISSTVQAFKNLAKEWHAQASLSGVKVKALIAAAYDCMWRRHQNGNLHDALYVAVLAPFPEAAEEEDAEADAGDVLQSMRKTVQSSSSAADEQAAYIERDFEPTLLLDPLQTFETPQERAAQAHADRWMEESMAMEMLDGITWADYVPEDRWWDLDAVFRMGMEYVDEFNNRLVHQWNMENAPIHVRVWLAELEWTWRTMMRRNWLPREIRQPHDRYIREKAEGAAGGHDPGNVAYEVLTSLLRVWQVADVVSVDRVTKVAPKPYGERGNMSASGPVNLRGNIIEALLRWIQQMATTPAHIKPGNETRCCDTYVLWDTWGRWRR